MKILLKSDIYNIAWLKQRLNGSLKGAGTRRGATPLHKCPCVWVQHGSLMLCAEHKLVDENPSSLSVNLKRGTMTTSREIDKEDVDILKQILYNNTEKKKLKQTPSTCLLWTGQFNDGGYGILNYKGKQWLAHRLSWILSRGGKKIPKGLQINHKCNIPSCIKPEHLYAGTQKQNINDIITRSRNGTQRIGIKPSTKNRIEKDLKAGMEISKICIKYNIRKHIIYSICKEMEEMEDFKGNYSVI